MKMMNLLNNILNFNFRDNIPSYKINNFKKYLHFINNKIKYSSQNSNNIWR